MLHLLRATAPSLRWGIRLFVEVVAVILCEGLVFITFREDDDVASAYVAAGAGVPATVNEAWAAEDPVGVSIPIIPEADVVDARCRWELPRNVESPLDDPGTLCRLTTMGREPRMSAQTLRVLGAILSSSGREMHGAEIGAVTKLASGTLYPILIRLEQNGWLESRWETEDPTELGRPRRRFYTITAEGARNAEAEIRSIQVGIAGLKWA